jgi:hypothetical protein
MRFAVRRSIAIAPATGDQQMISVVRELSFCRTANDVMGVVRIVARNVTGADGTTFILREGEQVYYAEENAIAPLWKRKAIPGQGLLFPDGR